MTENSGSRFSVPQDEEKWIYAEQVRLLYRNAPFSLLAVMINSSILVVILWKLVSHGLLIGWLLATFLITGLRLLLVRQFYKFDKSPTQDILEYSPWDRLFSAGIAAGGIMWGLSVIILFPAQSIAHQVFLAFVIGGMVAGSVAVYSILLRAFLIYTIPVFIPVTLRFFIEGSEVHIAMGIMMLIFTTVMIASAHYLNSIALSTIKLTLEKSLLLRDLDKDKEQLEELNSSLSMEISQKISISKELKEKSELYIDLFDNATDMIQSVGMDGHFLYVNRAWKENLGYEDDEIADLKVFDIIDPEYRDHCEEQFRCIMSGNKKEDVEAVFIAKNGDRIIVEGNINCKTENGRPFATRAIFRNITEKKRSEEALKESAARIRAILDTATDAIISINDKGIIKNLNLSAEKMFGYKADELIGFSITILMPEPYRSRHDGYIRRYIKTGEKRVIGIGREAIGRRKDGGTFPIDIAVSEVRTKGKRIFTGIIRDITERKMNEEALRHAKEEADNANRSKSEFLASMSHEIRTPMNAIIGMSELLWETPLTPEQEEYVQIFRSAGENLLNIINDILDISKVEAGRIELEEVEFDLRELIDTTCEIMAIRSHEKGLELICNFPDNVPTDLIGDPIRLRQILVNLLGNAIKFTDKGEIVLEIRLEEMGNDKLVHYDGPYSLGGPEAGAVLRFSVNDSGIGISEDKLGSIFDSFSQADASTTREYGGTGLGLTISKRLVELMGGTIGVESRVGKGSTFTFTVYMKTREKKDIEIKTLVPEHIRGLKTLIVDDNVTNLLILKETLAHWGAEVDAVRSGESALRKLKQAFDKKEPYRLLLLDCRMPEMDGFKVAEKVRDSGYLTGMPVMMLTSDNRKGDIGRAKELGISRYLIKPVKTRDLKKTITAIVGGEKYVDKKAALLKDSPALEEDISLNILLVDDSKDNRLLIEAYLRKTPHKIETAENGEIAVEKFISGEYDLVLMDVQMPVMDGYSATAKIRTWERDKGLKKTPIVALTAHAMKEDEQKSYDAGCDAHLTKPVKKAKLLETISGFAGMKS